MSFRSRSFGIEISASNSAQNVANLCRATYGDPSFVRIDKNDSKKIRINPRFRKANPCHPRASKSKVTAIYVIARNEATTLTIDSASEIASFLAKTKIDLKKSV